MNEHAVLLRVVAKFKYPSLFKL